MMHSYVDVALRVPPLFVMDELLKNMGPSPTPGTSGYLWDEPHIINPFDFKLFIYSSLKFCFAMMGCLMCLCTFMLWTRNLMKVYSFLLSVGFVFVSYWSNVTYMQSAALISSPTDFRIEVYHMKVGPMNIYQNLAIQSILGVLFMYIHQGPRYTFIEKLLPLCFFGPSLSMFLPLPASVLDYAPLLSAILPLSLVQLVFWAAIIPTMQAIQSGYHHVRIMLSSFGMATFVETEWSRLNVPRVLLTFWLLRVAEHAIVFLNEHLTSADSSMTIPELLLEMSKNLLVSGCDTSTAVLGMTSVVSHLCYYMGCLFQWVLLSEDEEKPIGTVSAMLFYILALQAGLTSCDPDSRLVRLSRNFCLLFTALLHFVHNYVHPLLLSLSASRNPALHRHIRVLGVSVFLIIFPITLLIYLWSHHNISTWLLAVSAFSIEVIIKVTVSLMIYSLFLLDAYRSTFWEKLDDYVYYIRAFGHVMEFSFGILLFMNSAWVLVFEAGGAVRAVMVGIHAYFNIWCDAQAGWRVFMKRRTAVNKINSLPEATYHQLQELNDVCSICYQEMRSAKITRCNHFFHGVCLRKWLYVQDRCPLCHDILYRVSNQD